MLRCEILPPDAVGPVDLGVWRDLIRRQPAFESPLISPEFALAVGRTRADARVAIFRRDGWAVGFLPHQQRAGGVARPIGAPLGDYQALVSAPDFELNLGEALRLAGLAGLRAGGLVDPHGLAGEAQTVPAYAVRLDRSADDYLEAIRARSAKRFKNWRRLDHALGREVGEVSLSAPDHSEHSFEIMLEWKRAQLARTNGYDFLRPAWTMKLMRELFAKRDGELQGLMIGLYAGDRLAAAHFGVQQNGVYHPWIAAADPELSDYSPGQIFLWRAIAAMPQLGLKVYDMGPSHDHYKRHYCLDEPRHVGARLMRAPNLSGAAANLAEQAWRAAGAGGEGFVGRLRRRLDIIDSVETTLGGRLNGLKEAAMMQARRKPVESYA